MSTLLKVLHGSWTIPEVARQLIYILRKCVCCSIIPTSCILCLATLWHHRNSVPSRGDRHVKTWVQRHVIVELKWQTQEWLIWIFVEQSGRELVVGFTKVGRVGFKRETWNKRQVTGSVVGSRKHYQVAAIYAITCHKSQGLTLPAIVVHWRKEFVPGLTYVACTRVKSCNPLQIVGFARSQLLPPSEQSL